jgi:hypothetical protein
LPGDVREVEAAPRSQEFAPGRVGDNNVEESRVHEEVTGQRDKSERRKDQGGLTEEERRSREKGGQQDLKKEAEEQRTCMKPSNPGLMVV